jgi:alpha-1,2-mannosyltransferase
VLLVVVATARWAVPTDEHAYWLAAQRLAAGQPLYDPAADPATPFAYWYPPPLAQLLVPFTPFLPDLAFTGAWTVLLVGCLWYLADRRVLVAIALVAFVPVAVELWFRNVHLVLAVLAVVALRRNVLAWVPAAAIKVTPVIALGYLVAARRYRDAALVAVVGLGVLAISAWLAPGAWGQFLDVAVLRGGSSGASLVPVSFPIRLAVAFGLAVAGGRLGGRPGETLLVAGLVIGNPTLFVTAFSLLIALVPLWSRPLPTIAPARTAPGPAPAAA